MLCLRGKWAGIFLRVIFKSRTLTLKENLKFIDFKNSKSIKQSPQIERTILNLKLPVLIYQEFICEVYHCNPKLTKKCTEKIVSHTLLFNRNTNESKERIEMSNSCRPLILD